MTPAPGGLLFVAWGAPSGRSSEISAELGGRPLVCFDPGGRWQPSAPLRWGIGAVRTTAELARRRPAAVVVTNPPAVAALTVVAYGALSGARVVLDDHPGSFGAQGDRVAARLLPLHRWMARRADACMVTTDAWVEMVGEWGGRGLVVHEAPGPWVWAPPGPAARLERVVFAGTFARDEPVEAVIGAARLAPEIAFELTGDPKRGAPQLRDLPSNVRLTGYLDPAGYRAAITGADAVVAMTTEPTSAMRAAFEAVWAGRPLVVSDWPLLAELFPESTRCANSAEALAGALRGLSAGYTDAVAGLAGAHARQLQRWKEQLGGLRSVLGVAAGD